jgi:hypothetical protein
MLLHSIYVLNKDHDSYLLNPQSPAKKQSNELLEDVFEPYLK